MIQTETGEPPILRTARRSGLIGQVIDQLRNQITSGGWPIGARIPTEAELAQLTGTSRNTVREAVQSLVHAGLLERRQGSGTYVLADSELAGAVGRRVATAHSTHLLEVRRTLEVGAARLAALRRTEQDVERLQTLLSHRNLAIRSDRVEEALDLDVCLHRAIGRAAHNPVLTELYENFLAALQESVRHSYLRQGRIDASDHLNLIKAIVARDSERAAAEAACYLDDLLNQSPAGPDSPAHS